MKKATVQKFNDAQRAYATVIAELRAMGLDDTFIAEFIDSGKAEGAVNGLLARWAQ